MSLRARLLSLSTLALIADAPYAIEPIEGLERQRAWRVAIPAGDVSADHLYERLLLRLPDGQTAEVFFSRYEGDCAIFRGVGRPPHEA